MSNDWRLKWLVNKIFRELRIHLYFIFVWCSHNMISKVICLSEKPLWFLDWLSFRSSIIIFLAHFAKMGIDSIFEFENFCFMHLFIGLWEIRSRLRVLKFDMSLIFIEVRIFFTALVAEIIFIVRHPSLLRNISNKFIVFRKNQFLSSVHPLVVESWRWFFFLIAKILENSTSTD